MKLSEFKKVKLKEEREQKLLKKKEFKKAKQRIKCEKQEKIVEEKKVTTENDSSEAIIDDVLLIVKKEPTPKEKEESESKDVFLRKTEVTAEDTEENNTLFNYLELKNNEEIVKTEVENKDTELVVLNENDEEFIGPKLPRMMTKLEIDAFKEELRVLWRS